jgi:hypothetical protein
MPDIHRGAPWRGAPTTGLSVQNGPKNMPPNQAEQHEQQKIADDYSSRTECRPSAQARHEAEDKPDHHENPES